MPVPVVAGLNPLLSSVLPGPESGSRYVGPVRNPDGFCAVRSWLPQTNGLGFGLPPGSSTREIRAYFILRERIS